MFILVVGINHKTAPVEVREKMTFTKSQLPGALAKLKGYEDIEGCAILATCNRTEIYAMVHDIEKGYGTIKHFISEISGFDKNDLRQYIYMRSFHDAVRHLFRVVSGLDSMVLGETQILGQIKEAYEDALENKATNNVLNSLLQQAISVGKRVRTETLIDQNAVSVSYVAVELAKQFFADLSDKKVLVLGAGEMSRLTARHLLANGVSSILVSNRSYDRAVAMAQEFRGRAVKLDDLFECLTDADILISATAARHYIINEVDLAPVMAKRRNKPLLLIDIAMPRDIQPEAGHIPGVKLFDIDQMQNVVDKNLEERKKRALAAEEIIEQELGSFFEWLNTLFVVPTIIALRKKIDGIKTKEMERAKNRLGGFSPREEKVIGSMVNSIIKQIMHDPIISMKLNAASGQGHAYAEICQDLFKLELDTEHEGLAVAASDNTIKKDGDELAQKICCGNSGQPASPMAERVGLKKVKSAQS